MYLLVIFLYPKIKKYSFESLQKAKHYVLSKEIENPLRVWQEFGILKQIHYWNPVVEVVG
jgi:hypothetical protein